jgi:hypothetical protein
MGGEERGSIQLAIDEGSLAESHVLEAKREIGSSDGSGRRPGAI